MTGPACVLKATKTWVQYQLIVSHIILSIFFYHMKMRKLLADEPHMNGWHSVGGLGLPTAVLNEKGFLC